MTYQQLKAYEKSDDQVYKNFPFLRAFKSIITSEELKNYEPIIIRRDQSYLETWDVTFNLQNYPFDTQSLKRSFEKNCKNLIAYIIEFPKDFPLSPPLIKIKSPRLQYMTGYTTFAGAICLQSLH